MQLTGAEHALLSFHAFDGIIVDCVEFDVGAVPIRGGAGDDNLLVGLPAAEHESPIANHVLGAGPTGALAGDASKFFNRGEVNRKPRVML